MSFNNPIDGYVLEGWFFQQFYFLDKEWIVNQVKENLKLDDEKWLAFLGGFAAGKPPFNQDIYQLFYPHYEKAIKTKIDLKDIYEFGIIKHLTVFYFWGFENLEDGGLLLLFLEEANPLLILKLVNFIAQQKDYAKSLKDEEVVRFDELILSIWTYLTFKFEDPKDEEEKKVLGALSKFIVFFPQLNKTYTSLIIKVRQRT